MSVLRAKTAKIGPAVTTEQAFGKFARDYKLISHKPANFNRFTSFSQEQRSSRTRPPSPPPFERLADHNSRRASRSITKVIPIVRPCRFLPSHLPKPPRSKRFCFVLFGSVRFARPPARRGPTPQIDLATSPHQVLAPPRGIRPHRLSPHGICPSILPSPIAHQSAARNKASALAIPTLQTPRDPEKQRPDHHATVFLLFLLFLFTSLP